MSRAATLSRLTWRGATVSEVRRESATASTLRLDVPGWPDHRAGQHLDVRLTAADGYTAARPYSIASAAGSGLVEITVDTTPGGEVSPYLAQQAHVGAGLEVRGPLGAWFVWDASSSAATQLIGAGSGVVPLMSMLRTHRAAGHPAPMRLLYSVPGPERVLFGPELQTSTSGVTLLHTRRTPAGVTRAPGRVTTSELHELTLSPALAPKVFVCGPTGFVEAVLDRLVQHGHDPDLIRAERYGEGNAP